MARPVFELRSAQSPDAPSGGVRVRLAALNDNSPPSTFLPRARGGRLSSSRETNAPVWFRSAPLAREATAGVPPLGGPGQDAPRARAQGNLAPVKTTTFFLHEISCFFTTSPGL